MASHFEESLASIDRALDESAQVVSHATLYLHPDVPAVWPWDLLEYAKRGSNP